MITNSAQLNDSDSSPAFATSMDIVLKLRRLPLHIHSQKIFKSSFNKHLTNI
jgi:hypothetical protein